MQLSRLKELRTLHCLSQEDLAEISGISIKTIQRIERGKSQGSAFTLQELAKALDVEPVELKATTSDIHLVESEQEVGLKIVRWMNLSALSILIFPFLNLIFPFLIFWKYKEDKLVERLGKRILSAQILWTIVAVLMLFVLSFLGWLFLPSGGVPIVLIVYFLAVFLNILLILRLSLLLSNEIETIDKIPNLL